MNKETHIIDIQNEKYHDSVRILQNMCKNYHANKWKQTWGESFNMCKLETL